MNGLCQWLENLCKVDSKTILKALQLSPSAQGYIHGALSELMLIQYLEEKEYEVFRIKEKPVGGYKNKKPGYKGDFLIKKSGCDVYYVVECKGLKSNAEIVNSKTNSTDHLKYVSPQKAFNDLKKYIAPNKESIYLSGYNDYLTAKAEWENANPGETFPPFRWSHEHPGAENADLTDYFINCDDLETFIEQAPTEKLCETSFKNLAGLYLILETHAPSKRKDPVTGIEQAGPLVSDFSIMAVDLFQRIGNHEFVFMNPDKISHSRKSPNHLYQNYVIDVLIPGKKDELNIQEPWYTDIDTCIIETNPKTVEYDATQLDFR